MQRENFMITKHHKKWLKEESDRKGVSMSEILRVAIDAYMVGQPVTGGKVHYYGDASPSVWGKKEVTK
jgi:hypothetical protein